MTGKIKIKQPKKLFVLHIKERHIRPKVGYPAYLKTALE